jgi:hypothetical protein
MRKRPGKSARGSVLDAASRQRLVEAHILYENGCYLAAGYLAGYAVEFALKATICRRRGIMYLEDRDKDHIQSRQRLDNLLQRAGLLRAADSDRSANAHLNAFLDH